MSEAFDLICARFPQIDKFRDGYLAVVRQLRGLLSVRTKYERPRTSRGSHPFIQSKFPEIRRDKFEPGKELPMAEFVRAALNRPPPLEEEARRAAEEQAKQRAAAKAEKERKAAEERAYARGIAPSADRRLRRPPEWAGRA